eukprot:TRINITY_DN3808_c0_g1::TRINITY_DN3808_c0_g1_i1::g.21439::m.21439 TRINITY_DN3808_c0_g1::TRINITY_DN3808_c0_g1_i1::g.21439  ORF type:complete len:101 (+),score=14.83,sp/Q9XGX7/TIM9_ORYSJ/50.00/7e-21,zf-Tim10_DDP/PF02953.10/4.7e-18,PTA_PTB/PF01515.14/0.038 TRINITY_DN3808_c0_g1_i1:42-305(+)
MAFAGKVDPTNPQMAKMMEDMQVADMMRLYNDLVARCFRPCVENFRSSHLDSEEEACLEKCAQKFLKLSGRAGMRFAEQTEKMTAPK